MYMLLAATRRGSISGTGTTYSSRAPEFTPILMEFVLLDLKFSKSTIVDFFVLFIFAILLPALRFTASDYLLWYLQTFIGKWIVEYIDWLIFGV